MQVQKTIKIPIYYGITKKKLSYLDNLIARLTYGVRIWYEIIEDNELKTKSDCSPHEHEIQEKTKLSSAFVQQSRDKALWMKKKYEKEHDKWEWMLSKAKKGSKWYRKLKQREPSKPFSSKRSKLKKTPTRFDSRTGKIEEAEEIKLADWVAKISTLRKYEKLTILLNPSEYHIQKLKEADKICSFEIVKHPERKCKYMIHVTCEYHIPTQSVESLRGVDLGVKREIASVKVSQTPKDFSLLKTDKLERLKELNNRISHLRREEKYEVLKKLRRKRRNVAIDCDRKLAKGFAETIEKEIVVVGNPQQIRYRKFKGNGDKVGRKILQHWTFGRQGDLIVQKCREKGVIAIRFNEWWTSKKCYKCGGKLEENKRRIECTKCGYQNDREFNSSIKLLQKVNSYLKDKSSETLKRSQNLAGATDELARTIDDSGLEAWMSMEALSSQS